MTPSPDQLSDMRWKLWRTTFDSTWRMGDPDPFYAPEVVEMVEVMPVDTTERMSGFHPDETEVTLAVEALSMTQCPAFKGDGVCGTGCWQEPACQVDQPSEGWIQYAITLLTEGHR